MSLSDPLREKIERVITGDNIVLFMKGDPQCATMRGLGASNCCFKWDY